MYLSKYFQSSLFVYPGVLVVTRETNILCAISSDECQGFEESCLSDAIGTKWIWDLIIFEERRETRNEAVLKEPVLNQRFKMSD